MVGYVFVFKTNWNPYSHSHGFLLNISRFQGLKSSCKSLPPDRIFSQVRLDFGSILSSLILIPVIGFIATRPQEWVCGEELLQVMGEIGWFPQIEGRSFETLKEFLSWAVSCSFMIIIGKIPASEARFSVVSFFQLMQRENLGRMYLGLYVLRAMKPAQRNLAGNFPGSLHHPKWH